ncbi:MAG: type II CRISPR-associated endonuclease Cas1 [Pseudomonadota bacterium]
MPNNLIIALGRAMMDARVVEISEPGRHLSLHRGFMVVHGETADWAEQTPAGEVQEPVRAELGRIALDQLAAVLCTARGVSHSSNLVIELASRHVPLVYCGAGFLPAAIAWPVDGHHLQSLRIQSQVEAGKPLIKRLWRELVVAKIKHQALVLEAGDPETAEGLDSMARRVKSGDPDNLEAQAARRYWPALMGTDFRRDRAAADQNALLNYGYAILRSGIARAIMAAGLHPSIGLHHQNRYNAMCLVDDLMEPYRPVIDLAVLKLVQAGHGEVSAPVKAYLAGLLLTPVQTDQGITPLHTVLNRLAQSLATVLSEGGRTRLLLPPPFERATPLLGLPTIPTAAGA